MSYFMFKVGTILHPTLYELNMEVRKWSPQGGHISGRLVCTVLKHNIVGSTHCYTTCPPCVTPIGSFNLSLSPDYILWVTTQQLWRCVSTVRPDCVSLPSKFTVLQL